VTQIYLTFMQQALNMKTCALHYTTNLIILLLIAIILLFIMLIIVMA